MKLTYEKPEIDFVDFKALDYVTDDPEGNLGGPSGIGGVEDDW